MPIDAGTRLGPYEIQAPLGAGGMGEVYRALDTRLDRTVAIKVLPSDLATDPQLRERFEREARAISRLSHPNICTLHDVGHENGIDFLVMEFLDGKTLESRLAKAPLKIDEALPIAIQIGTALDTAHRAGIVHRDLKPGNIFLLGNTGRTSTSKTISAKLLDFGLAKHAAPAIAVSGASLLPTTPPQTAQSLTAQGTILGTFQYMAPEQIEGQEADARTDIFAFGAVLYEMCTGRKAFDGKTRASLIGAILKDEVPPVSRDQALAPPALDRIVATCLAKDPDDRWQTMRDLLRELKWVADGSSRPDSVAPAPGRTSTTPSTRGRLLPWLASGVLAAALAAIVIAWAPWRSAPPAPAPVRLSAELGAEAAVVTVPAGGPGASLALSPDGSFLVFVGHIPGSARTQLYVRRLDQLRAMPLAGTENARDPFMSPDGASIGFVADGKLKSVSVSGGGAVTLCEVSGANVRGAAWGDDGAIAFTSSGAGGLQRVSETGGAPQPLTTLAEGETTHRWPQFLPQGKGLLFTASTLAGNYENASLVVQSRDGSRKVVYHGGYFGRYVASPGSRNSGYLLYMHGGTLFALAFDLDRLESSGQPVPVLNDVTSAVGTAGTQLAVSRTGTLVYLAGLTTQDALPALWLDRQGKTAPLMPAAKRWTNPHFSPDGGRLALEIGDGAQDAVYVYDLARDAPTKLTPGGTWGRKPVWTPNGKRIVFTSPGSQPGTQNLYWQMADGSAAPQQLTDKKDVLDYAASWDPTGKYLAFEEVLPQGQSGLFILEMTGDAASGWRPGRVRTYLDDPRANEEEPMFSPDGHWIAYTSNESGTTEVYVRPFPDATAGKVSISTGGGFTPTWGPLAKHELVYRGPDRIMAVSYTVDGNVFKPDKPHVWTDRPITPRPRQRYFDLHPDGERIAAAVTVDTAPEGEGKVVFFFNFADELKRITGH